MAESLPSGISVHSTYLEPIAGLVDESERHRVIVWDESDTYLAATNVTMKDAVASLREIFRNPSMADNPVIKRYTRRLRSFLPRHVALEQINQGNKPSSHRLQPSFDALAEGLIPLSNEDYEPVAELLGHQVSRADLIGFCSHVLTYTALEESDDPRSVFLDELRSAPVS